MSDVVQLGGHSTARAWAIPVSVGAGMRVAVLFFVFDGEFFNELTKGKDSKNGRSKKNKLSGYL